MSNHPVPDHNRDMMREDFGTEFLITDPKSDKILREVVGDHKHDLIVTGKQDDWTFCPQKVRFQNF